MRKDRRSRTAELVAAVRARHYLRSQGAIFSDPYAIHLTSPGLRRVMRNPFLSWLLERVLGEMGSMSAGQVLARARWSEDCLESACREGSDPYVVVGAGLDSFALRRRNLIKSLTVFELDHPRPAIKKVLRATARRGEPLIGFHAPADFVRRVTQLGFELVELVPPEDHEPRFLAAGRYNVRAFPASYFAHFRRRAVADGS